MNAISELRSLDGWQDDAAEVFRAMAHPVRLLLLEALAQEECCVCHLVALLRRRQPYISQQLMALREAGLVADRREGTVIYYRLANNRVPRLLASVREMVGADDMGCRPLAIPRSPVADCGCPKCTVAVPARG